jgi:hypothetical protein
MSAGSVAIVSLGRERAKGEVRRVESWRLVFERAGARVDQVPVGVGRRPRLDGALAVVGGRAAPERLAWSGRGLRRTLDRLAPDVVLVVSTRAFDPSLIDGPWHLVLDFVDCLSRSYHDRAAVVGAGSAAGYRALARAHARLERRLATPELHTVAAGWTDAQRLQAEWVPIVADPALAPGATGCADRDVLFFGTLRYPPNIDALERLARVWPAVQRSRPGTSALIAGSAPVPRVVGLCAAHGWELVADFPSLRDLAARARIAVAPLDWTAGMQIKVVDAAVLGLPQVVRSPALAGLDPDFPVVPHDDDTDFAAEIVHLLDAPEHAAATAATTRAHVLARYGVATWTGWAERTLGAALSR